MSRRKFSIEEKLAIEKQDKLTIASEFIAQGYETKQILKLLQIPSYSWYYRSTGKNRG